MKNEMDGFFELVEKNMGNCPWVREQSSEKYLEELFSEIEELRGAYSKGNWGEVQEELGDLLWDVVTLAYLMERERKIEARGVVRRVKEKISHRKPWLLSGEKVTSEEAVRIWKGRKATEKL